ncbi:MAG: hypothetical protein JOZ56_03970 [Actinobacteria bacterium]|nr:hypothetical protein [Actinomycetota bacterium]
MAVSEDVERIAAAAARFAGEGERVAGVLATEPLGRRLYLVAYESEAAHAWLALDDAGEPVGDRRLVREAAQLAALCEVAEDSAGGGHLEELRARLRELRETEAPQGIEEAEEAAAALAQTLEPEPRVARSEYLDALGVASRRLEHALGEEGGSPFAAAVQSALPAVEELTAEVERTYKGPLT